MSNVETHVVQAGLKPIPGIKNIIAVASGKGGVGKSTVAVNLALALKQAGRAVGLLDADIYGPSQPYMLGVADEKPSSEDGKRIKPVVKFGLSTMSIGYLVAAESAMIWRGPMVSGALQQLMKDTDWGELDYLIVDLPPGTGDVQLTMAQKMPITGMLVVTTPQDIALLDVRKAVAMAQKLSIKVLGVVENMSTHVCGQCGHVEKIFGVSGGDKLANEFNIDCLAQLPLAAQVCQQGDAGVPIVEQEPTSDVGSQFIKLAGSIEEIVAGLDKDYSHKFGNIEVI